MNGPKTATANWKTQYYLSVESDHGSVGGDGWHDAGTSISASVDSGVIAGPTGVQYVFSSWTGDASGTDYSGSDSILMNSPKTAEASWITQYYLTVSSAYGNLFSSCTVLNPAFTPCQTALTGVKFEGNSMESYMHRLPLTAALLVVTVLAASLLFSKECGCMRVQSENDTQKKIRAINQLIDRGDRTPRAISMLVQFMGEEEHSDVREKARYALLQLLAMTTDTEAGDTVLNKDIDATHRLRFIWALLLRMNYDDSYVPSQYLLDALFACFKEGDKELSSELCREIIAPAGDTAQFNAGACHQIHRRAGTRGRSC